MWIYLGIFVTIILYSDSGHSGRITRRKLAFIMLILASFVGMSDMLGGYDRYIYGSLFDSTADARISDIPIQSTPIYQLYSNECGYILLNYIISFLTSNRYIFITIITFFIYFLFYKAFAKETTDYKLCLILFLGLYFFFTFTYLRQALAVGVLWFSYRYIVDRDWKRYLLCMIIAASFHNSSIIFAPSYFLINIHLAKKQICTILTVALLLGASGLPSILFEIYGSSSGMTDRANQYMENSFGLRYDYILEVVVFLSFILSSKRKTADSRENLHYNLSIVFCVILLVFIKSLNGGRLSWPFMLGLICTLCSSIDNTYKLSVKFVSLVSICFLLYLRILAGWGVMLSPYKTYFSNGNREGDFIHAKYEYDSMYDIDKFYR